MSWRLKLLPSVGLTDSTKGIHMWCFDGLPDHYGQWDLETAPALTVPAALPPARPRLNSTGSVVGGILQPAPWRKMWSEQGMNW
jgi:hypothetical protein